MTLGQRRNSLLTAAILLSGFLVAANFVHAEPIPEGGEETSKHAEFNKPWKNKNKAIILDAYEKNHIDWIKVAKNKQIQAFIGKASDGLQSPYSCPGNEFKQVLCKKTYQNYFMKQQLYHTRRVLAKSLGLKWGAYHLGRPGNPVRQANHFLNFAKPKEDELIAIDIEHDDPKKWISFKDAEIFARHIHKRIGRYPVLYTNHDTAKKIAARRAEFPILSRLPLWYARFRSDIEGAFPLGNWETYSMWQFSAGVNCNKRRCLYRVAGTPNNIDVNVSSLTIDEFNEQWPFNELVPEFQENKNDEAVYASKKPKVGVSQPRVASLQAAKSVNLPTRKPVNSLSKLELAELGVDEIAIPSRSPRTVSESRDAVNLSVHIRYKQAEKSSDKTSEKVVEVAEN